jgi:hypothetical protein
MTGIDRHLQVCGDLRPVLIPRHGYYAGPAGRLLGLKNLPEAIPFRYRLRTVWLELCLHLRLAAKGFLRGLLNAEGILGVGRLHITVFRGDGQIEHLGLVSTRVIVDNGVTYLRDDFNNNAQDITLMNFHGAGTGTNAEAQGDSALQTECTTALNPDSTRATGTRSTPASNQFRSVGTLTFDADAAVTEHGILSQSATGGGTLWDRSKFAAINVVGANGDSIQFTYTLTLAAGG